MTNEGPVIRRLMYLLLLAIFCTSAQTNYKDPNTGLSFLVPQGWSTRQVNGSGDSARVDLSDVAMPPEELADFRPRFDRIIESVRIP
jgi:hypothetical protein